MTAVVNEETETNVTENNENETQEVEVPSSILDNAVLAGLLTEQVFPIIERIQKYNDIVTAESAGTPSREIDAAIKELFAKATAETPVVSDEYAKVLPLSQKRLAAHKAYREAIEAERNAYRVNVLQEEAQAEIDPSTVDDIDVLKKIEGATKDIVKVMIDIAKLSGLTDAVSYLESISIPKPGKTTSSSVSASDSPKGKRPRFESITVDGDKKYERLGDLVKEENVDRDAWLSAWEAAGEGNVSFDFNGKTFSVVTK